MDIKLYASHVKNCLDQSKIWNEITSDSLPDKAEADELIKKRVKLIEEATGLYPHWTSIGEFPTHWTSVAGSMIYPSALESLRNRPIILECIANWTEDWSPSILNRLFDHSHQTLFTDSPTLAENIKEKMKGVNICCLMRGTNSGKYEPSLNGLKFYHWNDESLVNISIFLDLTDATVIARQISDAVVLRGDNEDLARIAADITEEKFQPGQLLAIPGNAGCYTNKLIKRHWSLCDGVEDIKGALEDAKKKRGEE